MAVKSILILSPGITKQNRLMSAWVKVAIITYSRDKQTVNFFINLEVIETMGGL